MAEPVPLAIAKQIEAHKENLAASNEGRSVAALKRALDGSEAAGRDASEMKLRLRKCERNFFNNLEAMLDSEDPLQHFVDYIGKLDVICPSISSTQQKRALECCARKFLNNEKYRDDLRYVRIWLQYANLAPDPIIVYKYMAQSFIGSKTAKYYLSYARHLQSLNLVRQARAVFERALDLNAEPAEALQHGLKMLNLDNPPDKHNKMVPLPSNQATNPSTATPRAHKIQVYQEDLDTTSELDNANDAFPDTKALPGEMPSLMHIQQENLATKGDGMLINAPQIEPQRQRIEVYRSPQKSRKTEIIRPSNDQRSLYVAMDFLYRRNDDGETEEFSIDEIMLQTRRLNNLKFPRRMPPDYQIAASQTTNLQYAEPTATMLEARDLLMNARAEPVKPSFADYNPLTLDLRRGSSTLARPRPNTEPLESQYPVLQEHRPATPELRLQTVEFERLQEIFPSEPPSTLNFTFPEVIDPAAPNLRDLLSPVLFKCLQLDVNFVHSTRPFKTLRRLKAATTSTDLVLTNVKFKLRKKIASGGYGTVWPCINEKTGHIYALKGEKTKVPWEIYSLKMARSRIKSPRVLDSIARLYYSECFSDEQYHLMPLFKYNTLLSVASALRGRPRPEWVIEKLAAFVAIELLRVIEHLHQNFIIHGDLKAENVMMRAPDIIRTNLPFRNYCSDGSSNWSKYGIVLIDFGRAIDLKLFPSNQKFKAGWSAQSTDSHEIKNSLPWTYEIDYHGLAEVIHVLLYQDRMSVDPSQERHRISKPLKRSWDASLWNQFFDSLLNTRTEQLPICSTLFTLRTKFEQFLDRDSEGLQPLLVELLGELRRRHK